VLFNSYSFVLLYLPVVFFGFFLIGRSSHKLAALWLGLASLAFYGWWNPRLVVLLGGSILFNYALGGLIARCGPTRPGKVVLAFAVGANLAALGLFKYANFFIATADTLTGASWPAVNIVLPLGISFFTFTQIAFLVDVHRGEAREYNFVHYLLFVSYFPHLIAGPVLHHQQIMPQFAAPETYRLNASNVAVGLTEFTIGLIKKVLLADAFGGLATRVFDGAAHGLHPRLFAGWAGALTFTFQIYFDFSGYSDMAIGLSRLFGVSLPINFRSPYRAQNIIEFWRRWHMTLSQFLRDYLYVPLGGNRRGKIRRYANLMLTMLIGGLWHGANWTFVAWGGLHGLYLVVNHAWRRLRERGGRVADGPSRIGRMASVSLTLFGVVVAWVFFRSANFGAAWIMLKSMVGGYGISLPAQAAGIWGPAHGWLAYDGFLETPIRFGGSPEVASFVGLTLCSLVVVWFLPTTQDWLLAPRPARSRGGLWTRVGCLVEGWRPAPLVGVAVGVGLALILMSQAEPATFIYFQF
jgi:alginate O-acetyltransferase complex protein AlgI